MFLKLDQISSRDRGLVGGKALGLARLAQTGLPVPPALVLPVATFRMFLQDNGLWQRALKGDPSLFVDIPKGVLRPELAGRLREASARLGTRLAVRSSGVDEDGSQNSFAGQYATCLGVEPGDALEDAIRTCWASAYAPAVMDTGLGRPHRPAWGSSFNPWSMPAVPG